ncbi:MAG: orotidine-5'-phosphate decarboxylase [Acidiferrobacterales bacterium]
MRSSRVIVAVDFASTDEALSFVDLVSPSQCKLKVGIELFSVGGPSLVEALIDREFDVFLDLKLHDIPTTVTRACAAATRLGIWMLNVHTLGGDAMLRAARDAIGTSTHRPLLTGVTLLTSHTEATLAQIGLSGGLENQVDALAKLAQDAGLDGVVCSPQEAARLRKMFPEDFLLVTPGIRPEPVSNDDQARTLSPKEALQQGADYLVIGRPITRAIDPRAMLDAINQELGEV